MISFFFHSKNSYGAAYALGIDSSYDCIDIVISSLVFHHIESFEEICKKVIPGTENEFRVNMTLLISVLKK